MGLRNAHQVMQEVMPIYVAPACHLGATVNRSAVTFFDADIEKFVIFDPVVIISDGHYLADKIVYEVIAKDMPYTPELNFPIIVRGLDLRKMTIIRIMPRGNQSPDITTFEGKMVRHIVNIA
jgi:hypothetical protein